MQSPLIDRLKRRRFFQWAVAYLAGAWLLLQLLALLAEPFGWPDFVLRAATAALGVGFLAALVLAWYHGEKGAQRVSGPELLMLAGILVIAGAAIPFATRAGTDRATPAATASPAPSTSALHDDTIEQGSIVVLPFADMSPGHDQDYSSDGLTEELLNVLSQIPGLRVISRTSAFSLKDSTLPLDSIARMLRVAHVLEGSVRTSGTRIRITAQLIDAGSGYHIMSRSYDRELSDVFAVQDEIARAIVSTLELQLEADRAGTRLARDQTRHPGAHALLLRALELLRPYTREGTAQAAMLLNQAIDLDSAYARAWAELGRVQSFRASTRWGPREELIVEARRAAERALEHDPDLPEAYYVLGFIAHYHDWDLPAAESRYRRAIELNPGYARVHSLLGYLLMDMGRPEPALAEALHAVDLDPLDAGVIGNLASLYGYAGQLEQARTAWEAALAFTPSNPQVLANAACTHLWLGDTARATDMAERAHRLTVDDPGVLAYVAYIYGRTGRQSEAHALIQVLEKLPDVSPLLLATAHAGLDDADRVLTLLEQAAAERDAWIPDVGVDPVFSTYRTDPRMEKLLSRIGLS